MSDKRRIVYKADGSIAVIGASPKSKRNNETEQEWLDRVFDKAMNAELDMVGCDYDDVDVSEIPTDRTDRNAWTGSKGKGISVDQVKAASLRAEQQNRELIDNEIVEATISNLKTKGKLPQNYTKDDYKKEGLGNVV